MSHAIARVALGALATLVATVALAGSASAAYMNVYPSGTISLASSGRLSFTAGGITVACEMTLNGRIREGPIQISLATAGEINEASIGTCTGGSVREILGTPWTIKAESATGTLPDAATGVTFAIENFAFNAEVSGLNCLYRGTARAQLALTGTAWYDAGALRVNESATLRKFSGALCPETARVAGSLNFSREENVLICTEACRLFDPLKGRFEPVWERGLDFGRVAVSSRIERRMEFVSRTAWRVNRVRLSNTTDWTATGLAERDILERANYPITVTLRTRERRNEPYIMDYMLYMEPRDGNIYFYVLTSFGIT
jgi:hypothetical protein